MPWRGKLRFRGECAWLARGAVGGFGEDVGGAGAGLRVVL